MTSWYSNILTKTSTQISTIRSNLLSSEADGDTEDDTHVCRVLRAYYSEKGRPRPGWLPADPKAAAPAPQPMYAQPQSGSRYGGFQQQSSSNSHNQGQGGFSSLWDNGPGQQQPPPNNTPQSLRTGRVPAALSPATRPDAMQRTGSYASQHSNSGSSAQDRLKQRLYGGRGGPPASSNTPPPAQSSGWGNGSDPYSGTGGGQQRQGASRGYR